MKAQTPAIYGVRAAGVFLFFLQGLSISGGGGVVVVVFLQRTYESCYTRDLRSLPDLRNYHQSSYRPENLPE